jgi:hypothetical protein
MIRLVAVAVFLFAPVSISDLIQETLDSGRAVGIGDSPSDRVSTVPVLFPGAPPVLSFRYFDAADRGRFGNMGLMTDDAGH